MNTQKYAGAAWPFVLVVLSGIYGYWAVQRELLSSRPSVPGQYDVPDPVPPLGVRSLHSRLWQDPLSTAYDHWKSLPDETRATNLTSVPDSDVLKNAVQNAATSSSGSESAAGSENTTQTADEERLLDQAEDMRKFLGSLVFGFDNKQPTTDDERLARHAEDMRKFFRSLVDGDKTLCMPVLLPGGPYAEDKEKRMRIRYAVVTALAESGYSLKYSTRMSYVVVRTHVRVLRGWQEREIVVPVKLYRLDDRPQVLVLWINESELELRPLLALHRILNAMFSEVTNRENLDVSIIGPSSSGTLSFMSAEIAHMNDAFFPKVIHEANTFNRETGEPGRGDHDLINKAFANIKSQATTIANVARDRKIPTAEQIREKAGVIADTRSYGYIRELTKEIREAASEVSEATRMVICDAAKEIEKSVEKIQQESNQRADLAFSNIHAAARIANEIGERADPGTRKSIETEANILSDTVSVIWQTVDDINKMAKDLNSVEPEERITRAKNIKRAANKVELAEASAVIRRQAQDITETAYRVFQSEAGRIIKQTAKEVEDAKHKTLANKIRQAADKIANAGAYSDIRREVDNIKDEVDKTKFASDMQAKDMADSIRIVAAAVKVAGVADADTLADAYPAFQLEVDNAKAGKHVEDMDAKFKMLAAAVKLLVAAFNITEEAEAATGMAGAGETKKEAGPDGETMAQASKVIVEGAVNIKRIAAESKITGAAEIRVAADVVKRSAESVQRIAEDLSDLDRSDGDPLILRSRAVIDRVESEPVTVIQRAAAIIKQMAKSVEDGQAETIDLETVAQQVDRIRVAQAYELTKQAADRIAQNANNMSAKSNEIISEAYKIIRQLGGNIALNEDSNYWYATAAAEKRAQRMQGFMPLLSWLEHGGNTAQLLSPRATMEEIEFSENRFVHLHRVIGTDRQLAEALRDELKLRRAVPGQIVLITEHDTAYGRAFPATFEDVFPMDFESPIPRILADNKCLECHGPDKKTRKTAWRLDRRSQALEVIEPGKSQDSKLVRRLNSQEKDPDHTVEASQLDLLKQWIDEGATYERTSRIISFKILRGIDGRLPGDNSDGPTRAQKSSKESSPTDLPEIVERPPEGRTQYDYLKRLRRRIEQLHDVTAIGVVGSDVYDKLLVLRALKPHFPDCVFFTTDLDALYSHPAERQHARNLLIASHFDLRLHDQLQESTAPFRDSYQTSTFLATRLAIHRDDPDYWFVEEKRDEDDSNYRDSTTKWAAVIDHWFGGKDNKDAHGDSKGRDEFEVNPILHVVGRTSTHPLTHFDKHSIEAKLHPELSHIAGTWYYFFVGGFTLAAVGLAGLLIHRDRFRDSQLLNDEGDTRWIRRLLKRVRRQIGRARWLLRQTRRGQGFVRSLDKWLASLRRLLLRRGKALESHVNLSLIVLIGIGCGLVLVLCFRGYIGSERSDFLGGYSTWSRKILYGLAGIFAVLSVAWVLDQFQICLKEVRKECKKVGDLASHCFGKAHIVKIALLTVVIAYTGGVLVYELTFAGFWIPALATCGGLAAAWWYYAERRPPQNEPMSRGSDTANSASAPTSRGDKEPDQGNLVLGLDLTPAIGYGLISVIAVTAIGFLGDWLMGEPPIGWHPATTSRDWLSQFGDWFATAYAFGAVALLLSTLIYSHLWCREFARKAKEQFNKNDGQAGNGSQDRTLQDRRESGYARSPSVREELSETEEYPEDLPDIDAMDQEFPREAAKEADAVGTPANLDETSRRTKDQEKLGEAREQAVRSDQVDSEASDADVAPAKTNRERCREEDQKLKLEKRRSYWKNEHDRLWAIGKMSSASGRQPAVLMGLLFVLLMAYHPWLSPTPMPLSLVVMTTASVIVFILSALSLRWHFHIERDKKLSELRYELEKIDETTELKAGPPEEDLSTPQVKLREHPVALKNRVDPHDAGEPEAAASRNTVLELKKEVEEQEKKASRQQEQQQEQLKRSLATQKKRIEALSEGVFRSWNQSPIGWILGGGTTLALVDLWVRWWTIGM